MDNVLEFRKFTAEQLEEALELLTIYGNAEDIRSKRFTDFVRDSLADGMAEDAETASQFIKICIEVFRDMEADREVV